MTETKPEYHTDQDSGDEHRFGPDERTAYPGGGVYTAWTPGNVTAPEAVYWQAQAETAIRALEQAVGERDAALAMLRAVLTDGDTDPLPEPDLNTDPLMWLTVDAIIVQQALALLGESHERK